MDAVFTGPPSAPSTSATASASARGVRSMRTAASSVHSAVTSAGASTPLRTVATTVQPAPHASSRTSPADAGSSHWASSTTSSDVEESSARTAMRTSKGPLTSVSGARSPVTAPRRISCNPRVAASQRRASGAAATRLRSSRTRRVLPTPEAPATTRVAPSATTLAATSSSSARPRNGHDPGSLICDRSPLRIGYRSADRVLHRHWSCGLPDRVLRGAGRPSAAARDDWCRVRRVADRRGPGQSRRRDCRR